MFAGHECPLDVSYRKLFFFFFPYIYIFVKVNILLNKMSAQILGDPLPCHIHMYIPHVTNMFWAPNYIAKVLTVTDYFIWFFNLHQGRERQIKGNQVFSLYVTYHRTMMF